MFVESYVFQRFIISDRVTLIARDIVMTPSCPNSLCPNFNCKDLIIKDGTFYRKSESRWIQRFSCKSCGKRFSHATGTLEFGQNKRRINVRLKRLLCSGVSLRRSALLLQVHRVTIERKLVYLAKKAQLSQAKFLASLRNSVSHAQIDDLITIEHTKLKPLTVSIAVDAQRRYILGARVAPIGAFGHLAELSRRRYGRRKNLHKKSLEVLFRSLAPLLTENAHLESDEHLLYPNFARRFVPTATHTVFKSERSSIVGQGELKRVRYDPLFAINHSCAMLRGNINRLIRKTWCTTKRLDRLQMHLDIFICFYNTEYLEG
jgi:transposase-like protein